MDIPLLVYSTLCFAIVAFYAFIVVLLWKCYRRTQNQGFVWLGAALIVWPLITYSANSLIGPFVDQAAQGEQPWLFPFSLMGGPNPAMTIGEFFMVYRGGATLIGAILIAASLAVITRKLNSAASH